jgi:methylmalonyl-CoA epimerase
LLRNSGVAKGVDGDEEEGQSDGDDGAPAYGEAEVDLLVDVSHSEEAVGGDDESDGDQLAWVEFGRERSCDWEEDHENEAAGGDGHAGLASGVAHDFLEVLRDEDGGGVEGCSDHEHDELGHGNVAALEEAQVDDGVVDVEFAPEEDGECDGGENGGSDDKAGAEPVIFLALVEHDLEGADEDDEQAESPVVDAFAALTDFCHVGRVFDEALGEDERKDADRDIEEEEPAPACVVDDPATDGGAERGGEDDGHSVDGEGHAAFFGREGVGEDGLFAGLEASAGEALEDAEEDEQGQSGGESAEERGESEEEDAAHVEALTADAVGDPAADGEDDGVGDEVAGENPGSFADAGAEGAGHVGHGDIDDGGVERLHEGGEGDGDGDDPGIGFGPPCIVESESCCRQEYCLVALRKMEGFECQSISFLADSRIRKGNFAGSACLLREHLRSMEIGGIQETLGLDEKVVLDHLGIAVRSIEASLGLYEALGMRASGIEEVTHERVRVAMLAAGDSRIELLEGMDAESVIGRFVARRGEGLHHIALRLPDLDSAVEKLKMRGVTLVSEVVQVGAGGYRYVFVHPTSANGVLVELVELGSEGVGC